MESLEPKKLALIRIWQILKEHSNFEHPLTQDDIAGHLEQDYGIAIERKAISRNLSLLREAGVEIESGRAGSYLAYRDFENSELHLLIDGVLSSKHITAKHSVDLIAKLCGLSSKYFKSHVKNVCSVNDWSKTDNQALFYNIELIDEAIEQGLQIKYDYNKYGIDKKLHKTSQQQVSPYQLILHNQRYYLMAQSTKWRNMAFHRLDHITNMQITEEPAAPLRSIPGYENGMDYKKLASALPYMYTDEPEQVEVIADTEIIDQIIDWFGKDIRIKKCEGKNKVIVSLTVSPHAMEFWALQYLNFVEVTKPESLRESIAADLRNGAEKYSRHD